LFLDPKASQRVVWPDQPPYDGPAWTCKASWKSEAQDPWPHQPGRKPYSAQVQQRHRLRAAPLDCGRSL